MDRQHARADGHCKQRDKNSNKESKRNARYKNCNNAFHGLINILQKVKERTSE